MSQLVILCEMDKNKQTQQSSLAMLEKICIPQLLPESLTLDLKMQLQDSWQGKVSLESLGVTVTENSMQTNLKQ